MKRHLSGIVLLSVVLGFILNVFGEQPQNDPKDALFKEVTSSLTCSCGCGLLVSACEPADCATSAEIRGKVHGLIDQGDSKAQIMQAMVVSYGEQILAAPPKEGFNLTAYVLPFVFLIIGGYVLLLIITRWLPPFRGANNATVPPETSAGNANESSDDIRHLNQIEKELKDLDR